MTEPGSRLPDSVASVLGTALPDPSTDDALAADLRQLTFRRLRVAGVLFALVHVASTVLVLVMSVEALLDNLPFRTLIISISLGFAAVTYVPRLERHALGLSMGLTLCTATYVLLPLLRFGLGLGSDEGGLVLLIVCAGLLFPYTQRQMLLLAGVVTVMYLTVALLVFDAGSVGWLLQGLFYLGSASAMAVVGARLSHRLRLSEFVARHEVARERDNAERLLLNILPRGIVERLKKDQTAIAQGFSEATVMFADLVGFTELSAKVTPTELVALLNDIFSRFDALTEKHGLEKIKTIGDAYMVAGGLPIPRGDHAVAMARLAIDMREVVQQVLTKTGEPLRIRIGMHTGPVAAGVIGTKKFTYDLWGDTVNIAARMESHSEPGIIQITERTADLLRSQFQVEPRGMIDVKGKGAMQTFILVGLHRSSLRPG